MSAFATAEETESDADDSLKTRERSLQSFNIEHVTLGHVDLVHEDGTSFRDADRQRLVRRHSHLGNNRTGVLILARKAVLFLIAGAVNPF